MTFEMKLKDVLEEGKLQGLTEGKKDTLIMLVNEKLLAVKNAANQLGLIDEDVLRSV